MCNCVQEINEKLAEANKNTAIDVPYQLSNDLNQAAQRTKVVTAKADRAVRKRPINVFASYCPFCGTKYGA